MLLTQLPKVSPDTPVLIAGPTASGKSALALAIAERDGREVINADALQVYDGWRILAARPDEAELSRAPHRLYGHVPIDGSYSVGDWLRDISPLLSRGNATAPVIVGGTGLYFTALTEGLAEIPATHPETRAEAGLLLARKGIEALIQNLDADTRQRIDTKNPMRVQRAWEVQRQTGRGLAAWHRQTRAPLLPLSACRAFVLDADRGWLNARIARRFDAMMAAGALEEARQNEPDWDPARTSSQTIGAKLLIAALRGELDLSEAVERSRIATRQYAKRQRSWLRSRMRDWQWIAP